MLYFAALFLITLFNLFLAPAFADDFAAELALEADIYLALDGDLVGVLGVLAFALALDGFFIAFFFGLGSSLRNVVVTLSLDATPDSFGFYTAKDFFTFATGRWSS